MAARSKKSVSEADTIATLAKLLEKANRSKALDAASVGACLISTPGNPRPTCVQVTPQQCGQMKGMYVGGKCP